MTPWNSANMVMNKVESESRGSHLNPNPRTNKQETDVFCKQL